MTTKPSTYPLSKLFSSGPCTKYPGWSLAGLAGAVLGRSHRSVPGKSRLAEVIALSREVLRIPEDFRVGIVPASDTGAFEAALWSLLGPRGVDVLTWESFGHTWAGDIAQQLKIADTRVLAADYGSLPNLSKVSPDRDIVFAWNGTTSGVCVPDAHWISRERTGLTLCDATSAAFAMDLPWDKLDVATWSWQKALGGEAQHGMVALGPRAVARLESWAPPWPLPKIFRLTSGGRLNEGIFRGETINTPSMLAVEDHLNALRWAKMIGGLDSLIQRSQRNLAAIEGWVAESDWAGFLAEDKSIRSCTSVCLKIVAPEVLALEPVAQAAIPKRIAALLETEDAAYDIGSFRDAPPGLRIWAGATVETADLDALFPWLDWAYAEATAGLRNS